MDFLSDAFDYSEERFELYGDRIQKAALPSLSPAAFHPKFMEFQAEIIKYPELFWRLVDITKRMLNELRDDKTYVTCRRVLIELNESATGVDYRLYTDGKKGRNLVTVRLSPLYARVLNTVPAIAGAFREAKCEPTYCVCEHCHKITKVSNKNKLTNRDDGDHREDCDGTFG